MRVNYKGFEIDVRRDESMGGYEMFYWGVFRISDQREMHSGCDYVETFETDKGKATVRDQINEWKQRVDQFLAIPEDQRDDRKF